jgi:DHA2 family multidrug resistance protein-like MFS transporter
MASVVSSAAPRAGRREWTGLAVIALPCLLYAMDLTVLNMALPSLSEQLMPSSAQLLWIVDIYGFLVAGSLITMGTLGDRIGRRRLLLIGAAAFGVASVMAAFSTSAAMLIATRALLGLAGATFAPSTLSLIRNMFLDADQRTTAIGVWVSSYSVGGAIGPLVGGLVLERFWWGAVFLVGVPVMLMLLIVGPSLLPEYRDPKPGRLDVVSAMLSLACVLPVIYGLKQIAQHGLSTVAVAVMLIGVAAGVMFVRRQRTLADPLIDLRLFQAPAFGASLALYTGATFVLFGVFVFIGQYLQLVLGLSPLHAGLWTMPFALSFVVGSTLTPLIVRRISPTILMACGLVVAALGFALLTFVPASGPSALPMLVTSFVMFCLALAPVFTLATDVIVSAAPPERAGAAAALSETGSEFGGALGIAVLGSIGTAVYRSAMSTNTPPGVPADAAIAARDTLGGALTVAGQLPDGLAAALVTAARDAFTRAMDLTAIISVLLSLVMAAIAFALYRSQRHAKV